MTNGLLSNQSFWWIGKRLFLMQRIFQLLFCRSIAFVSAPLLIDQYSEINWLINCDGLFCVYMASLLLKEVKARRKKSRQRTRSRRKTQPMPRRWFCGWQDWWESVEQSAWCMFLVSFSGMKINKSINCTINKLLLASINYHVHACLFFMSLALSLCIILTTWLHSFSWQSEPSCQSSSLFVFVWGGGGMSTHTHSADSK